MPKISTCLENLANKILGNPTLHQNCYSELESITALEKETNFILKANSAFIDNNLNLKCYPTLINTDLLHNIIPYLLKLPTFLTIKVCTPKEKLKVHQERQLVTVIISIKLTSRINIIEFD